MMLRPATTQDAAAMAAILSTWIDETPWMPRIHTLAQDRGFVDNILDRTIVAEVEDIILGFLTLGTTEVECLYVAAPCRSRGVGRALLDQAKAENTGLYLWTFAANLGARQFYAREGFAEVAQTDGAENAEKLPDVRLEWRIEDRA
jgi:GNAT superfamily N-acetyltransferase